MNDFAAIYRELVVPRLRLLCTAHGSSIAHGLENFTEGFSRVMREAITLGASHLPTDRFDELEDHLLTSLSAAAWDAETKLNSLGVK